MARFPKCPDCNVDIEDKTKAKKISNRWVCESCQKARESVQDDRQSLYDYIAELFDIEFPSIWMMKQVKDFKTDYQYTYTGMELTLRYWNETLGNSMDNAKGVGIIPYIYDDAKTFFIEKRNVINSINAMDEPFATDRSVSVLKSDIHREQDTKSSKMIDMNDL